MNDFIKRGCQKLNINLSPKDVNSLLVYLEHLLEYNSHTNLTAIREPLDIIEKHFFDSMLLCSLVRKEAEKAIDIGTGAGFPGMVLAILNPNISFTLMDSVRKKTKFLEELKDKLKLENVEIITGRAEEVINDSIRETYDLGLCRGVSKLNTILEYMMPFLKVGGYFLAQKMSGEEIEGAKNAFKELKSEIIMVHGLELPFSNDKRIVIEVEKKDKTDKKYPRKIGMPSKNPL